MIYKQKSYFILRIFFDLVLLNISFLLSAVIAQSWNILIDRNYMFILMMALNIVWYFSSSAIGLYDDFSSRSFPAQFVNVLKNSFSQAVSSIIFIFITKENLFTRNFILLHAAFLTLLITSRIIIYRKTLKYLRKKDKNVINLLIVGGGNIGNELIKLISDEPELGYKLAGFVDIQKPQSNSDLFLGTVDELEIILVNHKIEEVIIALPNPETAVLEKIINVCNNAGLRSHIIPDYTKFLSKKFRIGLLGNFPLITFRDEPLEEIQLRFIKRSFDLAITILIIITVLSWLIPIIIILQKLFSPGKIFFIQDRIGKDNKKFKCYKFRTLVSDSQSTKVSSITNERMRSTKLGAFLRKSSFDELPQFFNVLIGNMSIVGPRPYAVTFESSYKEFVDYIKLRHLIKPGITGWAQIHGLRGDVDNEEENKIRIRKRIELDLWYIENWSFWLDVQIIMLTAWQIIKAKNKGQ